MPPCSSWYDVFMLRRVFRIIIVASGIMLVSMIVTSQWVGFVINAGRVRVVTHPPFVRLVWGPGSIWNVTASDAAGFRTGYFAWPRYMNGGEVKFAVLPWWSVSLAWVSLSVPTWILTRRKRLVAGSCPTCSYDLRSHHPGEKCPACGRVIEAGKKV